MDKIRPPAARNRSSPGIDTRTKLTIPSLAQNRESLFAKVVSEDTTFAKLGGRDGQIVYRPLTFSRFWSGDENNASEGRYHTIVTLHVWFDFICSPILL